MPTTSVRRRISLFSRSSELFDHSWRQCSFGKAVKASSSGPTSSKSAAASGKRPSSWATTRACCSQTQSASGWAKVERTIVATKPCALLGTRVKRLRVKWVRQRCQATPGSVAAIASTRPGCASEVTSLTPARPRATNERRKASQAAPSSLVTTSRPSDSRKPSWLTPTACTTQTLTVRPPSRHLTTSASKVTYAYVTLDALVVKCREGGRTVNVCVVHAVGVNQDGFRESLGLDVVTSEDGAAWLAFLRSLVARGLAG